MRENRLSGLEGGVAFGPSLPLSGRFARRDAARTRRRGRLRYYTPGQTRRFRNFEP